MASSIEVRDPDDEIVAHGAFVHIERMDDDRVWMSITTPDGRSVHIDFTGRKGRKVGMHVQSVGAVETNVPDGVA